MYKGMRSRTGCLTCRQRKLKCDEQKPVCGQCTKANRQCQPSSGLTFRHQHNASMNADGASSIPERSHPLSGFYSYKNTFDANTIWVDVPRHLTFFNTTNPYLDPGTPDLDGHMPSPHRAQYAQQREHWNAGQFQGQHLDLPLGLHSHGLEALSAAALYSPPEANMVPRPIPNPPNQYEILYGQTSSNHNHDHNPAPPGAAGSSSNNLNFLLNPSSAMDSPIDPSLMSSVTDSLPSQSGESGESDAPVKATNGNGGRAEPESEQKVAYLLRHISESPGSWCVK